MEPRHREIEADQGEAAQRAADDDLELGPDEDDTGYDEEVEDEPED